MPAKQTISAELRRRLPELYHLSNEELAGRFECCERLISSIRAETGLYKPRRDRLNRPGSVSSKIRAALRNNPDTASGELAHELGCSVGLVSQMRRALGLPPQKPGRTERAVPASAPAAVNKQRPAWKDEQPHLSQAARLRQLWPAP